MPAYRGELVAETTHPGALLSIDVPDSEGAPTAHGTRGTTCIVAREHGKSVVGARALNAQNRVAVYRMGGSEGPIFTAVVVK